MSQISQNSISLKLPNRVEPPFQLDLSKSVFKTSVSKNRPFNPNQTITRLEAASD